MEHRWQSGSLNHNRDGKNNLYVLSNWMGVRRRKSRYVKGGVGEYEWSHDGT
jgi:hypothetical protein